MRASALALVLAVSACATIPFGAGPAEPPGTALSAADAATAIAVGSTLTMVRQVGPGPEAPALLTLRHADGRSMRFEAAANALDNVVAQAPGGPLAQVMGLLGEEQPELFVARASENRGAPFLCVPGGPYAIGLYETTGGAIQLVALREPFQSEVRPDGSRSAAPYSPDQVCARLRLRR